MRTVLASALVLVPLFASCASSVAPATPSAPDPDATCPPKPPDPTRFPLDPVELHAGREVAGDDAWTERHEGYVYVFANAANAAAFRADRARYAIRDGGACGRMGPLSGRGSVTLHAVHAGELRLFASKNCRAAFLAAPEKYLEADDPAPEQVAPEARRLGAAAVEKALAWMGGARQVDGVRTLVERRERDEASGGRTYRVTNELRLDLEHGWARAEECWDASCFGDSIGPRGAYATGKEWRERAPSQRVAFEREASRGVLATLRRRHAPDALVYAASSGPDARYGECTVVAIRSAGCETRLVVRDEDGAIAALEYVGRRDDSTRGPIRVLLDDWHPCGSIRMPHRRVVTSVERPEHEETYTSIEVDASIDPASFSP